MKKPRHLRNIPSFIPGKGLPESAEKGRVILSRPESLQPTFLEKAKKSLVALAVGAVSGAFSAVAPVGPAAFIGASAVVAGAGLTGGRAEAAVNLSDGVTITGTTTYTDSTTYMNGTLTVNKSAVLNISSSL